jgi:TPR repeat protein
MKWNLKAYKQGHSEGANNIGELYEKGHGVPKNIEKAKSWYKKSSVLGNAEATERLERLSRRN